MKNPLHRKKLQLAMNAFTSKVREKSSELDYIWVTRKTLSSLDLSCCDRAALNVCLSVCLLSGWLDDIGLPQYKDQFHEARVDGRMIQYLTVVKHSPLCR